MEQIASQDLKADSSTSDGKTSPPAKPVFPFQGGSGVRGEDRRRRSCLFGGTSLLEAGTAGQGLPSSPLRSTVLSVDAWRLAEPSRKAGWLGEKKTQQGGEERAVGGEGMEGRGEAQKVQRL